jgi:hypothetical protein
MEEETAFKEDAFQEDSFQIVIVEEPPVSNHHQSMDTGLTLKVK